MMMMMGRRIIITTTNSDELKSNWRIVTRRKIAIVIRRSTWRTSSFSRSFLTQATLFSVVLVTWRCSISHCRTNARTHIEDQRVVRSSSFFLYSWLVLCLASSFQPFFSPCRSPMQFFLCLASWVRYSTRDIHKQQAVSWYKQTPRFHKVFSVFFSFSSSFKRIPIDEENKQKAVQSRRLNFVYLLSNLSFLLSRLCKTNLSSNQSVVNINRKREEEEERKCEARRKSQIFFYLD